MKGGREPFALFLQCLVSLKLFQNKVLKEKRKKKRKRGREEKRKGTAPEYSSAMLTIIIPEGARPENVPVCLQ